MKIKFKVTRVFIRNWKSKKKIIVNRGGTRSTKTYSICQLFANWLMTGWIRENLEIKSGVASIVRKYKASLKKTAMRDFESILKTSYLEDGTTTLYSQINHNKTGSTYTYKGRTVEFFGADDEQKLKGYGSKILYCNEADELGFKREFFQLNMRTESIVFIDFNPSDPYTWIKTEIEDKRMLLRGDVDLIVSTYKDNPFLARGQIQEIELLEETAPDLWEVYGKGNYGFVKGLIIPKIQIVDYFPDNCKKVGYGLDFGFTNDPTSFDKCGIMNGNHLFIDEIIYETGLTASDICTELKTNNIPKRSHKIIADSASPESIETISRAGYNIHGAKKGKDSVKHGLGVLKNHKIFVTARSAGIIKEQKKYKYKQDRNGNWLNEPIDAWNHGWDAVRYYGSDFLKTMKNIKRKTVRKAIKSSF